jgi:hypothetical protein
LQPLDEEGKAIQLMRSWLTVMPGETRSCVGCHEDGSGLDAMPFRQSLAALKEPVPIAPWYGPTRGFSFAREIQPVLDKYCISCHDGSANDDGNTVVDLRANQKTVWAYQHGRPDLIRFDDTPLDDLKRKYSGLFPPSYVTLRKHLRVGGLESDLHLLPPMEFHADTSHLVQMLRKGHHGVELNGEAWDRLITWIDLNAPCYGTWSEFTSIRGNQAERRCELRAKYGGQTACGETVVLGDPPFGGDLSPVVPRERTSPQSSARPEPASSSIRTVASETAEKEYLDLPLGEGISLRLVKIHPALDGNHSTIRQPFWMGGYEVTNRQYAQVDPRHDSRFEHRGSWIFSEEYLGWPLNAPDQPVVRVSWEQAQDFCRRVSQRTGRRVRLPSEQEWEYACRGGTSTPFWFGSQNADYSQYANLGDRSLRRLAADSWNPKPPDLTARDERFDDGYLVSAPVGSFAANPWGLHDMHGNVAEWTSTWYAVPGGRKTVRGGSWRDLPGDAHASQRYGYYPYQKVFNVGFRVVCEVDDASSVAVR